MAAPNTKKIFNTLMAKDNQDPFAGGTELASSVINFNKIGDWFKGAFIGFTTTTNAEGKQVKMYEFIGDSGVFHNSEQGVDENGNKVTKVVTPPVQVEKGVFYKMWGGKKILDEKLGLVKKGQIVGIKFESTMPAKKSGYSPTKVFLVKGFGEDPEYMGQSADDLSSVANTLGVDGIAY